MKQTREKEAIVKTGSGLQAFATSSTCSLIPTEPESNHIAIYPQHTPQSNNTHSSSPVLSLLHDVLSECMFPVTCDL